MTEETLFNEALSKPPAEHAAFLDAACAGLPQLRAAVEALLAAHERSGNVLDQRSVEPGQTVDSELGSVEPLVTGEHSPGRAVSPQAVTTDYRPASGPGAVIAGRYTLQEKIGEGGMGEVWIAKQTEPVKRKVALKLIKAGMDTKAVLQRFEQERQALAIMEHPNIARVIDGGMTADRRPFFVMELVNGLPLTKFCDETKLGIRERLELFAVICQAVQHAHQKGIIHRDLKPSNILVTLIDARTVPKVIDFGVAKAIGGKLLDESLSTQFGAVVGTLEYMSPEQAGLSGSDIDTRADIYSLGVILYELLTGLRPIDTKRLQKAAYAEMIRIIQEDEPSKPSTRLSTDGSLPLLAALRHIEPKKLMTLLRGELDWVVMKCLEKQRERRYETANGLARDIQRYLADEVVEARPPSTGYRLKKFVRRHKGQVIAAGLVLFALLAGMVGTTWGLIEAKKQEGIARAETVEKEQARAAEADRAEGERLAKIDAQREKNNALESEKLALHHSDTALKALTSIVNQVQDELEDVPGTGEARTNLLNEALRLLRTVNETPGNTNKLLAQRLMAHFQMGNIYWAQARRKEAEQQFKLSRDLALQLLVLEPKSDRARKDAAASTLRAADAFIYYHGEPEAAVSLLHECVQLYEAMADELRTHPQGNLAQPLAQRVTRRDAERGLADTYDRFGEVASRADDLAKAVEWLEKAKTIRQRLYDETDKVDYMRLGTPRSASSASRSVCWPTCVIARAT